MRIGKRSLFQNPENGTNKEKVRLFELEEEEEEDEEEEEEEEPEDQKKTTQNSNILLKTGIEEDKIDKNTRNFTKTGQKTVSGPSRGSLGRPWETLWGILECLGRSRWGLGGVLGASWGSPGQSWDSPGRLLEGLERTLGARKGKVLKTNN